MMKSSGDMRPNSQTKGGRNVIICCDGTGITEHHTTGQAVTPSNILKIFNCVDTDPVNFSSDQDELSDEQSRIQLREQVAFYERGVASVGNTISRAGAGMTGFGIASKIMIMYNWLGHHWQKHSGDEEDYLFLFGFSRGAFAVRSLMGMIYRVGLLDLRGLDSVESARRVKIAYNQGYRKEIVKSKWAFDMKSGKDKNSEPWPFHGDEHGRVPVHFMGVFDTVGQLGLPRETWCLWTCAILCCVRSVNHQYHDVSLNPTTRTARSAVAIDEMRSTFQPVFSREHAQTMQEVHKMDIKHVWFPGAHGNIGGGLVDCGLSDIALKWMVEEASKKGLRFKKSMIDQIKPDYKGNIFSTHGVSVYKNLTHYPRCVPAIIPANSLGNNPKDIDVIHDSAIQRSNDPPIADAPYFDTKYLQVGDSHDVILRADRVYNHTSVYLEAGAKYKLTAEGQWAGFQDRSCGPEGYSTSAFRRPAAVTIAVGIGRFERGWRRLTGNKEANLPFTRRHDHYPWYCVMGMIATGGIRDVTSKAEFHTIFGIGREVEYEVTGRGGYLYAYCNDTWGKYTKNKGLMEMRIERIV